MGQPKMSDAVLAATNVRDFRNGGYATVGDDPSVRPSFLARRLEDLGVLEMAPSTNRPSGISINVTNATFIVLIIITVAGGFYWTWERGQESGIKIGEQTTEKRVLQERLDKLQEDLNILQDTKGAEHKKEGTK